MYEIGEFFFFCSIRVIRKFVISDVPLRGGEAIGIHQGNRTATIFIDGNLIDSCGLW